MKYMQAQRARVNAISGQPSKYPARSIQNNTATESSFSSKDYQPQSGQTLSRRGAFTVNEFCGWASIGRSKFYQEVAAGKIVLRKIGRKSVVTLADAEAWLNALPTLHSDGQP